jgi:alginate O-acetyltransferase complex protein AlgJ
MNKSELLTKSAAIIAFCFLVSPTVALLGPVSTTPPQNREPAAAPSFADRWHVVAQLGDYLNDRLPLKDTSLRIDSYIDRKLFKEQPAFGGSATPRVLEGEEGYLFLKDDFDAACNGHGTPESVSENLRRFADIIQRSGRKVVAAVAPDKSSVLIEKLPRDHAQAECHRLHQEQIWESLNRAQIAGYVDLRNALRNEVVLNRRPLYFRQDSHWNQEGSLAAVKQLVEKFQPDIWEESAAIFNGITTYTGDLEAMRGGAKTDETPSFSVSRRQIEIVSSQYDENYSPGYRRLTEMSGPPGSLIEGETVLMFDSFGMAAIEQIVPYFRKLNTVHLGEFLIDDWIKTIKAADNVLFLSVERGLGYRLTYDMGSSQFLDALDLELNGSK